MPSSCKASSPAFSHLEPVRTPVDYDYVGIYLTDRCHLNCSYCITRHHNAPFGRVRSPHLTAEQWIAGINRLVLPDNVPVTLQGGEPFLFPGVWDILEGSVPKIDIMTALPPFITRSDFENLATLAWNRRPAPYPTIRVSYHRDAHDAQELVQRIASLQEVVSIGLYYLEHPENDSAEIDELKLLADRHGIDLRSKAFLGEWQGKHYGQLRYPGAADGIRKNIEVRCRNTVVPIAPDGRVYRCHSDLYFGRRELALGNLLDHHLVIPENHLPCANFGLCNACDVKVKTNHNQVFGYTSVDIQKEDADDT
ncbi:MAG: radical SAM protein [Desulfobacterales bacterium]|nr:radical SAM protein [Desulfobacterales bacterium]